MSSESENKLNISFDNFLIKSENEMGDKAI